MQIIFKPFIIVMEWCYLLCNNYGLAIILFTFVSKIILLPLSIWLQYNSIKMVKMQPDLNYMKAKFFGDRERIADEESAIYKKYKYNPFISIIPTIIQLILLMAVIEAIKAGMMNSSIDMMFMGFSLAVIPSEVKGLYLLSPVIAALSALLMCICQNRSNVIQAEQSSISQMIMLIISVGLSLYLGFFVSVGVAVYWVFSNLFSTAQLYILNFFINPKKYVDYERLEDSKKQLEELNALGKKKGPKTPEEKAYAKKEKEDYKKFFSVVNKHLVFYSESNGFYKYYAGMIEYLLEKTNITIHYITSDPNDNIFEMEKTNPRIRGYYIAEKKLITLMMKMDADIVVMTVPDLENFHIKRSYVRKDIEYLYVQHGMGSVSLTYRKGALDHYDTILSPNKKQTEEIRAQEALYKLPEKKIIECGYFILDDMIKAYEEMDKTRTSEEKTVLIAPSWQDKNIVDSCLDELLTQLESTGYKIIVRPHPQHVRHKKEQLMQLKERFASNDKIEIQLDFSATDTVWKADLLITDWSDISMEYSFCTNKPVLFINTPMKIMNPEYDRIDVLPINIEIREIVGTSVDLDKLDQVREKVDYLFEHADEYAARIADYRDNQVYNIGHSAEIGGRYVAMQLMERAKKKKDK